MSTTVPRLQERPCGHCTFKHYFIDNEDDRDDCPKCGGGLYPIVRLLNLAEVLTALMTYVQHKPRCDALQPMWHQGPCDCGLVAVLKAAPDWVKPLLGPDAFICPQCGDKGVIDGGERCQNCEIGRSVQ